MIQPSITATVLLIYAATPSLPPSVSLGDQLSPPVQQWVSANPASLPIALNSDAQLNEICSLESNWDGYGGLAVHPETATNARTTLHVFQQSGVVPEMMLNPNGTISFEWSSDRGEAHLELGKSRFVAIVRPRGTGDISFAGDTTRPEGLNAQMRSIAIAVVASLFPPDIPALSSNTFTISHARWYL